MRARVPATSANLGPGFDCLGLAVALYNTVVVEKTGKVPEVVPTHDMVAGVAAVFFRDPRVDVDPFGFEWSISGDVPISRGLGSSVTLRLGVLACLNEISGSPLGREELFELCTEAEGHPDNAGPGVFGGFVITSAGGTHFRFPVDPRLRICLVVPEYEVLTDPSRGALPISIPHGDAVRNTANAASLTAAFATGDYEKLRGSFGDFLHQGYRSHLVPGLFRVIEAGEESGALGGYLSGSGSTVACLAWEEDSEKVLGAMIEAHGEHGRGRCRGLSRPPDNEGVSLED